MLRVRAVYEDGHGTLEQVFSAQTAAVTAVNNGAASLTLAGVAAVGTTLTAVLGTDPDGAGTTPTFQWFRDGVAVGGATAATFLLTATDLTHHISVQVNYTDGQGFAEQVTSASTGAVGAVSVRPANIATTNTLSASNNLVNLFGTPIVGGIHLQLGDIADRSDVDEPRCWRDLLPWCHRPGRRLRAGRRKLYRRERLAAARAIACGALPLG